MRMGSMCDGGAEKPCSDRRAGYFLERSADLADIKSHAGANICCKKRSCFALWNEKKNYNEYKEIARTHAARVRFSSVRQEAML